MNAGNLLITLEAENDCRAVGCLPISVSGSKVQALLMLAEVSRDELVIGVAGRFWRSDGGRCMGLTAEDFAEFSRPGYTKVAWNFKLRAESPESTLLSTETRTKCVRTALWKFHLYWSVVGYFSGLIRKAILKRVKTEAE